MKCPLLKQFSLLKHVFKVGSVAQKNKVKQFWDYVLFSDKLLDWSAAGSRESESTWGDLLDDNTPLDRNPHRIPMLDTHTWYPCLILIQDTRFHWNPRKMPTLETHVWHPHKIPMLENQPKQEQSTWQQQCLKTSPTEFPSPVGFKQMVLLGTALPTFSKGRVSNSPSSSSVRQFS